MAVIIPADWEQALGIVGASTPYGTAQERPLFEGGQTVYRLTDLPASGVGGQTKIEPKEYTVSLIGLKYALDGGSATQILDQLEDAATPSDMLTTPARAVFGWQHTATPGATTGATTNSNPYFYNLTASDGSTVAAVHQSQLTDETSIETYMAAEMSGWIG